MGTVPNGRVKDSKYMLRGSGIALINEGIPSSARRLHKVDDKVKDPFKVQHATATCCREA